MCSAEYPHAMASCKDLDQEMMGNLTSNMLHSTTVLFVFYCHHQFLEKNQTTKPQLYCQGVKWYSSGEPPEGYIFSTTNVSGHTSEMKPVSAAEDFRIPSLLLWMYNYFVHKMPGDTVVSNEETIYLVRECTLETQPDWLARAQCFDVWDQQEVTVIFKLKNPK